MINCIIVDDDKADRKHVENIVGQVKYINVVKTCGKLSDAKNLLLKQPIDILFLNIKAPGKNGIGLLEDLSYDRPGIIVTSNTKDVACEAYDIDADDFILKPVTVPRLIKSITKALTIKNRDEKQETQSHHNIFIRVGKHSVKVALKDVFLVEALADYVHIYTTSKRYTIHATMKAMERKLPQKDFIRVHKSYIVRIDNITGVKRESLSLDRKTIRISNTYRKELMERLKVI